MGIQLVIFMVFMAAAVALLFLIRWICYLCGWRPKEYIKRKPIKDLSKNARSFYYSSITDEVVEYRRKTKKIKL